MLYVLMKWSLLVIAAVSVLLQLQLGDSQRTSLFSSLSAIYEYSSDTAKQAVTFITGDEDAMSSTYDWLTTAVGLTSHCPYVEHISASLKQRLPLYIQSQEQALNSIEHSAAAWEFTRQSRDHRPLIWAFTGPTGVGKSETALRVAETALGRQSRINYGRRSLPAGLLVLRGEDFSVSSLHSRSTVDAQPVSSGGGNGNGIGIAATNQDISSGAVGVSELRSLLAQRVILHLRNCGGNAVIVLEEVQKIAPGVLEVLLPALEKNGQLRWKDTAVSTSNCIFIFISDIGADVMVKLLLAHGGDRLAVPTGALRREVKLALDQQWDRLGVGKSIDEVVPFLPLEREHLQLILATKLHHLSVENEFIYWLALVVDPAVIEHLVGPEFIAYTQFSATSNNSNEDTDATSSHSDKRKVTKVYSTWGARALENGGPLEDLRGLLFRFMQPWRPRQILHVGLADARTASSLFAAPTHSRWTKSIQPGQIYLQWCEPPAGLVDSPGTGGGVDGDQKCVAGESNSVSTGVACNSKSGVSSASGNDRKSVVEKQDLSATIITAEQAFSDACETIWFGSVLGQN